MCPSTAMTVVLMGEVAMSVGVEALLTSVLGLKSAWEVDLLPQISTMLS
jgi:hypothetical protein